MGLPFFHLQNLRPVYLVQGKSRKTLSQQSVCPLSLDRVRFHAWGVGEGRRPLLSALGSSARWPWSPPGPAAFLPCRPLWGGCPQEVKELTVDPSPAFPGKGQELGGLLFRGRGGRGTRGELALLLRHLQPPCIFNSTDFCKPAVQSEPRRRREGFQ